MTFLSKVVPLAIFFAVLTVAAFIGYVVYTIATDVAEKTSKKMEKKNISFGKEGMKIGVKEVRNENYVDQTQRYGGFDGSLAAPAELTCFLAFKAYLSRPGITRAGRRTNPASGIKKMSRPRRHKKGYRK